MSLKESIQGLVILFINNTVAFIAALAIGSAAGYWVGEWDLNNTERELQRVRDQREDCFRDRASLNTELGNKDTKLREACKGDDFEKLKDDNKHIKTSLDKCEKDAIEREEGLARSQRENNVFKNRGRETEEKYKAQLSKIDSFQAQYDKIKSELSRCQNVVNERTSERCRQCDELAKQIKHNAGVPWTGQENETLSTLRSNLQCSKVCR